MATLRTAETESREEEWNMFHDYTGEKQDERVIKDDENTWSPYELRWFQSCFMIQLRCFLWFPQRNYRIKNIVIRESQRMTEESSDVFKFS